MPKTYPFSVPSGVDIIPDSSGTDNLGSPSNYFDTIYVNHISGASVGSSTNLVYSEVPTGDVDGFNNQFRTFGQSINSNMLVFKNGLAQTPSIDYINSVSTITMTTPPPVNSKMLVSYQYSIPTVPLAWDVNVVGAWDLHTDYADGTVYGNNLIPTSLTPTFTSIAGRQCPTNFASNNNFYHIPTTMTGLNGLSEWTAEFQIYSTTNPGPRLFSLLDTMVFYVFGEGYLGAGWYYCNLNNAYFNFSNGGWIPNVWQAISLVKDATTMKLYIEGNLISNTAVTWTWTTIQGYYSLIGGDWYAQTPTNSSIRNVVLSNIARTTFPTVKV